MTRSHWAPRIDPPGTETSPPPLLLIQYFGQLIMSPPRTKAGFPSAEEAGGGGIIQPLIPLGMNGAPLMC
jgi:hypothetical protein